MKKSYINPVIEVVKIETHSLIANSVGIDSTTKVDASSAEGRSFDFTEDE